MGRNGEEGMEANQEMLRFSHLGHFSPSENDAQRAVPIFKILGWKAGNVRGLGADR